MPRFLMLLIMFCGFHAILQSRAFGQQPDFGPALLRIAASEPENSNERAIGLNADFGVPSTISLAQSVETQSNDDDSNDEEEVEDNGDSDKEQARNTEVEKRNQRRIESLRKPIRSIRITAKTSAPVPESVADEVLSRTESLTLSSSGSTLSPPNRYTSSFCHRPLYFEELNLERCGNTYGCATNAVSGFHFLTNTAMLPYRLATQRPDYTVPTRGDCQTCQEYSHDIEPFGFEPRGVLVEAAAAAGFVFLMM